jgi:hypothetical protein
MDIDKPCIKLAFDSIPEFFAKKLKFEESNFMKLKKVIVPAIFFLLSYFKSYSQEPAGTFTAPVTSLGGNMQTSFNLGELMGTNVSFTVANDPHIKGTPFFYDSFLPAVITLRQGAMYNVPEMRLNLATNDLHFKRSDSTELIAAKGIIRTVAFHQNIKSMQVTTTFSSGYPAIDNHDENTFYQEMVSGRAVLLKVTTKILDNVHSITASPLDKQYIDVISYYVSFDNRRRIERWHKGKDFILQFFRDKKEEIEKFIEKENLKCKTADETKKIIEYYNSLQ